MSFFCKEQDILPLHEFQDITDVISVAVKESEVSSGLCVVYSKHTTACIRILENELLLMHDMHAFLERIAPSCGVYKHDDIEHRTVPPDERINGFAHIRAMFLNHQECIPIVDGDLDLGKWQRVFYIDCDFGKPDRKLNTFIIGA